MQEQGPLRGLLLLAWVGLDTTYSGFDDRSGQSPVCSGIQIFKMMVRSSHRLDSMAPKEIAVWRPSIRCCLLHRRRRH